MWSYAPFVCAALAACGNDVIFASLRDVDRTFERRNLHSVQYRAVTSRELERLIRAHPADIVYPMTEHLISLTHDLPAELRANCFPRWTDFQRKHLEDRRELYALVQGSGVKFPEIMNIDRDEDLDRALQRFGLPLVIRGTAGTGGGQVRIVKSADSLRAAASELRAVSPDGIFAQRFITGRRCIAAAVCIEGKVSQLITQRVLEAYPHDTSPSLVNRSFHSDRLTASAEAVFGLLGWTGFVSTDFIEDDQGRFYLLEVNPRIWGSVQVAEVCGVPMFDAFSRLINEQAQLPRRAARPDRTVVLFPQYITARREQGRLFRVNEVLPVLRCLADAPMSPAGLMRRYARAFARRLRGVASTTRQPGAPVNT